MPRSGVAKREYVGTAVFRGDKMVGFLDSMQTRLFLMVAGKYNRGTMSFEDPNVAEESIVVDLRLGRRPKIKASFDQEDRPIVDVKINLEADIDAIQSRINYESTKMIDQLNNHIENEIKEGISKTIEKTQKELASDIFEFGNYFAGYFTDIDAWEKYNWLSHYPKAKVNVDVDVNIRRTGLMIYSAPVKSGQSNDNASGE